ncbi:hypothetical protein LO771_17860 [Streptacidiphilus sp. ASG 303]|uniref:hypothetical protein n=1 Tax=Streptacidiphilus sp. ASG 303 TaxID=2896847 RepID=UPI001E2DF16D|nr:hypothetical protein [Streptacidiphilus sp. ASG 303]MCD0484208.1 hypothetical protein [Streptacidiphilus sp. ASG 303]
MTEETRTDAAAAGRPTAYRAAEAPAPAVHAEPREAPEPLARAEAPAAAEPLVRMEARQATEPLARAEAPAAAEPLVRMEARQAAEPLARAEAPAAAEPLARMEARQAAEPLAKSEGRHAVEPALESEAPTAALPASARIGVVQPPAGTGSSGGSGTAAGSGFKVAADQYAAAAGPLQAVADRISELYTSLNGYLSGLDAPWGDDHAGHQFADGEKGYVKFAADTLEGLKSLPEGLRNTAEGLKAMAENYTATEEGIASGMDAQDEDLQATQGTYWSPGAFTAALPRTEAAHVIARESGSTGGRH